MISVMVGGGGGGKINAEVLSVLEEGVRKVEEDPVDVPELKEVETDFCGFKVIPFLESEYSSLPDLINWQVQIKRVSKPVLTD